MRNYHQQRKWKLFKRIELTKDKKKRSALLEEFNNMIPPVQINRVYGEDKTDTSVREDTQETKDNGC